MAGPGNQHCANCIGTLSFGIFLRFLLRDKGGQESKAAVH